MKGLVQVVRQVSDAASLHWHDHIPALASPKLVLTRGAGEDGGGLRVAMERGESEGKGRPIFHKENYHGKLAWVLMGGEPSIQIRDGFLGILALQRFFLDDMRETVIFSQ